MVREPTARSTVHHESIHSVYDFILVSRRSPNFEPRLICWIDHSAYPAPNALSRALLLAHHDSTHPHHEGEEQEGGIVPISDKSGNRPYWRFVGLTGHPPVDSFLKSHAHLMSPASSRSSSPAAGAPVGENDKPRLNLRKLGTDSSLRETAMAGGSSTPTTENFRPFGSPVSESVEGEVEGGDWGAVISKRDTTDGPEQEARVAAALEKAEKEKVAKPKKSRFSLATLRSVLERTVDVEVLHVGDLQTGNNIKQDERGAKAGSDALDAQLGPWRFGEEGVDVLEDSTFVFLDPTHSRTVAARRKHFCVDNGKNRKSFKYDPDVIYAASFFSNFCDLNSFDLTMGPLKMNIAEYFRVSLLARVRTEQRLTLQVIVTTDPIYPAFQATGAETRRQRRTGGGRSLCDDFFPNGRGRRLITSPFLPSSSLSSNSLLSINRIRSPNLRTKLNCNLSSYIILISLRVRRCERPLRITTMLLDSPQTISLSVVLRLSLAESAASAAEVVDCDP